VPVQIPDKLYFKIGEAAEIVGVETHVLRYWESEFPQIQPTRAGSKQRLYRRQDIDLLLEIKRLLYDEKFTISGARKRIAARARQAQPADAPTSLLSSIRRSLLEIKTLLGS